MKAIDDFYAAWDAASEIAFLEEHAVILRQFAEYIDYSEHSSRKFWAHVRFMTAQLWLRKDVWIKDAQCYKLDKLSVELGAMTGKSFAKSYRLIDSPVERPVLLNPYKGLRNAAKDAPVASSRKSSFEDAPNPRQRRDIDPKNLSPDVRARLYPDWQPKPRKSRNKPGTSLE
jgi:hypothetical protein